MDKVYLGPWQEFNKGQVYFRPVLKNHKYVWTPEIYRNGSSRNNTHSWYYLDNEDNAIFGTLEETQNACDKQTLEYGCGLGRNTVVFLTQEQFDKLKVLI